MSVSAIRRKLVVVGDRCGKTSLLTVFAYGHLPLDSDFLPTTFDNHVIEVQVDDKAVHLALWDTAVQCEYDRLRPLAYPNTHVVLICFAIDYPFTLETVEEKWLPEISYFLPEVPIILVGCKKDLRLDNKVIEELKRTGQHLVTPEEGTAVAQKIKARHYMECSAKTGEGVDSLLQIATTTALLPPIKKRRGVGCIIL